MNWRAFSLAMVFLIAAIVAFIWLLPGIYAASATGNATAMLSELVFTTIVCGLLLFIAARVAMSGIRNTRGGTDHNGEDAS